LNEFIERTEIKEISQEYWQEAKKTLDRENFTAKHLLNL